MVHPLSCVQYRKPHVRINFVIVLPLDNVVLQILEQGFLETFSDSLVVSSSDTSVQPKDLTHREHLHLRN